MMKLKLTLTLILSLSLAACSGRGTSPTETPGETDAPSSDSQEQTEAPKLPAPTQKKQKGLLRGKINLPLSSLQRIETTVRTEVEGNGNDGTDGSNGINGGSGSDGTDGADGSSGQDGNSGKDGRDGRDAYGNLSYCGEITRAAIFIGSASVDLGIREVNTCSDDGKSQVVRKYKHRVMPHNLGHDLYFECDDAVKDKKSQLCTDGMISDESFSALSQTMNAMLADAGDSSIDEFVIVTHGAINEAINGNSYLNDLRSQGNRIFPLDDGTLGQLAFASAESALTNGMGHESSSLVVWYLDDFTSIWAGREHHPKRTQKILVHSSKHKIKNMGHRNGSTNAKYSAVPGVFREAFKRRAVYRSGQRRATPEKAQS